jgi:hypothetical protein
MSPRASSPAPAPKPAPSKAPFFAPDTVQYGLPGACTLPAGFSVIAHGTQAGTAERSSRRSNTHQRADIF